MRDDTIKKQDETIKQLCKDKEEEEENQDVSKISWREALIESNLYIKFE